MRNNPDFVFDVLTSFLITMVVVLVMTGVFEAIVMYGLMDVIFPIASILLIWVAIYKLIQISRRGND